MSSVRLDLVVFDLGKGAPIAGTGRSDELWLASEIITTQYIKSQVAVILALVIEMNLRLAAYA